MADSQEEATRRHQTIERFYDETAGAALPARANRASDDVPRWLVVRQRECDPVEVYRFDEERKARLFFEPTQDQWVNVFLCRVVQQGLSAPTLEAQPCAPDPDLLAKWDGVRAEMRKLPGEPHAVLALIDLGHRLVADLAAERLARSAAEAHAREASLEERDQRTRAAQSDAECAALQRLLKEAREAFGRDEVVFEGDVPMHVRDLVAKLAALQASLRERIGVAFTAGFAWSPDTDHPACIDAPEVWAAEFNRQMSAAIDACLDRLPAAPEPPEEEKRCKATQVPHV